MDWKNLFRLPTNEDMKYCCSKNDYSIIDDSINLLTGNRERLKIRKTLSDDEINVAEQVMGKLQSLLKEDCEMRFDR